MKSYNSQSIKTWAAEDRPREKLRRYGLVSLSDAELLAIIISSGSRSETVVDLSRRILLDSENRLDALACKRIAELRKYNGIGEVKAMLIIASLELGRRQNFKPDKRSQIGSSNDAAQIFLSTISNLEHEEMWILFLNRGNKIIRRTRISQGGVSGTVVDSKLILREALEVTASGIIMCHNHPSGTLSPSLADRDITEKVKAACKFLDIRLLDHIIVCQNEFYSFADNALL